MAGVELALAGDLPVASLLLRTSVEPPERKDCGDGNSVFGGVGGLKNCLLGKGESWSASAVTSSGLKATEIVSGAAGRRNRATGVRILGGEEGMNVVLIGIGDS